MSGQAGALRFEEVGFAYPGGAPVLADVTWEVMAGERVAVLGANGAGKSTLLLHANGLLRPTSGRVLVEGVPVTDASVREVRRRVGFVFQDAEDQLFLPTLLEDVAFGPLNAGESPVEAEARARSQLAALGLGGHAGRAAHHLSGGERRLAALATVLVSRPSVLVLDEPTAGLDARARATVARLLLSRNETLVLATHDLELAAAVCDQAVVLAGGRVVATGGTADLLADRALLRDYGLVEPLDGDTPVPWSSPRP